MPEFRVPITDSYIYLGTKVGWFLSIEKQIQISSQKAGLTMSRLEAIRNVDNFYFNLNLFKMLVMPQLNLATAFLKPNN